MVTTIKLKIVKDLASGKPIIEPIVVSNHSWQVKNIDLDKGEMEIEILD